MTWVPGEELLIKWSSIVERLGVGLASPYQIKREGLAQAEVRRHEKLLDAQTTRDIEDIRSGKKVFGPDNKLIAKQPTPSAEASTSTPGRKEPYFIPPETSSELIRHARNEAAFDSTRRILNLRAIAHLTEEELGKASQSSASSTVDDDWLTRWKVGASDVSDEQMRALWAKLLAGEVSTPGRFSLRTVDLLRNLNKSDAEKIAICASFALEDFIVYDQIQRFAGADLSYARFLELEEIGILNGVPGHLSTSMNIPHWHDDKDNILIRTYGARAILIQCRNEHKTIKLPIYNITGVGRDILSLGTFVPNEDYLAFVAKRIKAQGCEVAVGDLHSPSLGQYGVKNPTWYR